MPSCIIIDEAAEILYIHGRTGRFLEPAEGKASLNLLKMARPGLKRAVARAFREVKNEGVEHRIENLYLGENGGHEVVHVVVRPLMDSELGRGMMLVLFEEAAAADVPEPREKTAVRSENSQSAEIKRLQDKLRFAQRNLQATIGELETSNEELKSANEELQSTNEELQSTNEELETSKEELQSLNEESATVNTELQKRIDELVAAKDDMQCLMESTEIAAIVLNVDFNIRKFTAKVTDIFPLTSSDVGRPLTHFASKLQGIDLQRFAKDVLDNLAKKTCQVTDTDGNIYQMSVKPFRTAANVIDGVIFTFENITELERLRFAAMRLAAVVKDSSDALLLLDADGAILAWNRGAQQLYGYTEAEALKMNIRQVVPPERQSDWAALIARCLAEDIETQPVERLSREGRVFQVSLAVTRICTADGTVRQLATTERELAQTGLAGH